MKKRFLGYLCGCLILMMLTVVVSAQSHVFHKHENSSMKIALTFDDGPHPRYTREILNILDEYHITATFFVVGENVEYYPDSFSMLLNSGHEIGNHTYSHQNIKNKSEYEIISELEACNDAIYGKCGVKTNLFRPPGGIMADICISNTNILSDYNIIYWSIDTLDWAHERPETIADNVIKNIKSGDIILMHDYVGRNSPTPEALKIMIPKLLDMGYEFVTVGELISR